jgi:hypothetical protein
MGLILDGRQAEIVRARLRQHAEGTKAPLTADLLRQMYLQTCNVEGGVA